jgi:hypothetical protein
MPRPAAWLELAAILNLPATLNPAALVRQLWPLTLAAAAVLLFAAKLLRVSRGDVTVALEVAETSDKGAAFLGMVLSSVPLLLVLVWALGCCAIRAGFRATRPGAVRPSTPLPLWLVCGGGVLCAVSAWLALAVPSWPMLTVLGVVSVWVFVRPGMPRLWPRRASARSQAWLAGSLRRALTVLAGLAFALGLFAMDAAFTGVLSDDMWLPAHRLVTTSGVVVGYELSKDDGTVTVLRHADRTIVFLSESSVTSDALCEPQSHGWESAWDAWRHLPTPDVPLCFPP